MARPQITLKLATSLDGKIALANGQSEWITGDKARQAGRALRGYHDAIAIGSNTAVIDNPQLTTRLKDLPNPIRIVFDSQLRISVESELAKTAAQIPLWIFCKDDKSNKAQQLKQLSVRLYPTAYNDGVDILAALDFIFRQGVSTLLVEGGGTLAASFIKANVIDRIEWFRAPLILGGDARSCFGDLGLDDLNFAQRFTRISLETLGDDSYEIYERLS